MASILIPEILFLIAARCDDYQTLVDLTLTCKDVYSLLAVSHKKSLVKTWVELYNRHTGRLPMLATLNWSGTVLDTIGTPFREAIRREDIVPPFSFRAVRELDARRKRIDALFGYEHAYEDGGGELPLVQDVVRRIWKASGHEYRDIGKFVNGLKRACVFLDTMVDCAAGVHIADQNHEQGREGKGEQNLNKKKKGEDEDEEDYVMVEKEEQSQPTAAGMLTREQRQRKAHWAMRRYLLSIADSGLAGVEDLTYLYVLVQLVIPAALSTELLIRWHPDLAGGASRAEYASPTMVLAMQEVFLRYGSVVLQGLFLTGDGVGNSRTSPPSSSSLSTTGGGTLSSPDAATGLVEGPTQPSNTNGLEIADDWFPRPQGSTESCSGGSWSGWLSDMTVQVVVEIITYEQGPARRVDDEEEDSGTGVLPGLSSALYQAASELFMCVMNTGTGGDTGKASFSGDDGGHDGARSGREVRDRHLRDVAKIFPAPES